MKLYPAPHLVLPYNIVEGALFLTLYFLCIFEPTNRTEGHLRVRTYEIDFAGLSIVDDLANVVLKSLPGFFYRRQLNTT